MFLFAGEPTRPEPGLTNASFSLSWVPCAGDPVSGAGTVNAPVGEGRGVVLL